MHLLTDKRNFIISSKTPQIFFLTFSIRECVSVFTTYFFKFVNNVLPPSANSKIYPFDCKQKISPNTIRYFWVHTSRVTSLFYIYNCRTEMSQKPTPIDTALSRRQSVQFIVNNRTAARAKSRKL